MSWNPSYLQNPLKITPKLLIENKKPALMRAFSWSGTLFVGAMVDKERFALGDAVGCSGHVHRLRVLRFDVPVAMADRAGDTDVSQAQDLVLCAVS